MAALTYNRGGRSIHRTMRLDRSIACRSRRAREPNVKRMVIPDISYHFFLPFLLYLYIRNNNWISISVLSALYFVFNVEFLLLHYTSLAFSTYGFTDF